ncbi:MAG TPA: MBOAT family protein [Firmicutes bacterium]|nr:MBOAT family protein [Bacillota bacterium]
MVFSSLLFLGIFFPIVLVLYFINKNTTYRNVVLVIASLIFYAWGEPVWVLGMLFSSFVGWFFGLFIDKYSGRWQAKASLIMALVINLGMLGVFKYSGWIVGNINALLGTNIPFYGFSLPLGISFYTFQILTYDIDMYRGEVEVQKNPVNFLCYVSLFPQLVAGPIVRYIDIQKQIDHRVVTAKAFGYGILRFTQGMVKKVVLANGMGAIATSMLDGNLLESSALSAWVGILAYTFQIYFDFSGYSDMAIGMGRMFGFNFLENFNYPYISKNITDFWRRWHISLSTFFRDYVYIPLGGNRKHQLFNIMVVWMLTGLWHGASWNFVFWGLYYGILLIIEKKAFRGGLMNLPPVINHIYTMLIVIVGWALFYYTDTESLKNWFICAFGGTGELYDFAGLSTLLSNLWLFLLCAVASTPVLRAGYRFMEAKMKPVALVVAPVLVVVLLAFCFTMLVGESYNPFLYFRF